MNPIKQLSRRPSTSTAGGLYAWAEAELAGAGVPSPRADAAALTAHACGWGEGELTRRWGETTPGGASERLAAFTARRCHREPLQLIIGKAPFLGLDLTVTPGVFIPRPETEGLALRAGEFISEIEKPVILDLCAGVGPVAVYLGSQRPNARVVAVEIDGRAASLLRQNASAYGVRVDVIVGDVRDEGIASQLPVADLVVANPPYVETTVIPTLPAEVSMWEPRQALDGGADGLAFYPVIAGVAAAFLRPGGVVAVEIGESHAAGVADAFRGVGSTEIGLDLTGRERYLLVRKDARR
jgi:release factor glutamine methyltransferase